MQVDLRFHQAYISEGMFSHVAAHILLLFFSVPKFKIYVDSCPCTVLINKV